MNKQGLFLSLVILLNIYTPLVWAQPEIQENSTLRTIMLTPDVDKGASMIEAYNNSDDLQTAIREVSAGFLKLGVQPIDFIEKVRNDERQEQLTAEAQASIEQTLAQDNDVDIIVRVKYRVIKSGGNSVEIGLRAFDAYSAEGLAVKTCNSRIMNSSHFSMLAQGAVNSCLDEFLNTMQQQFTILLNIGRTAELTIDLDENSSINFNQEDENYDTVSDKITDWLREYAHKGNVSPRTTKIQYNARVKVPVRYENGTNFLPQDLAKNLRKFMRRDLEISSEVVTVNGLEINMRIL